MSGRNNYPNVIQLKYALRIIIRNSIEPSQSGKCTLFDDSLCESSGLLDFQTKRTQHVSVALKQILNSEILEVESMMIAVDD